jgi:hypothetical protein
MREDFFVDDSPATDYSSRDRDPSLRDGDAREAIRSGGSVAGVYGLVGGIARSDSPVGLFGAERKTYPVYSGVLGYFPAAIAQVAHVSHVGNAQHNPGEPLHWAREKSTDQGDTALRHIMDHENDPLDSDGCYHLAKAAWRILARLQIFLEEQGAPKAPLAR